MDVLWGAWCKTVTWNKDYSLDIVGIYEDIMLEGRADFPHKTNLNVIISYQAQRAEQGRAIKQTLIIRDLDGSSIFEQDWMLSIPQGDTPLRWYETYDLENITFKEPGYYELTVLVNGDAKQIIPLNVNATKVMMWDEERDMTIEAWEIKDIQDILKPRHENENKGEDI